MNNFIWVVGYIGNSESTDIERMLGFAQSLTVFESKEEAEELYKNTRGSGSFCIPVPLTKRTINE